MEISRQSRPAIRALFCLNGPNEVNGPNVWLTRHLPLLRKEGIDPEVLYVSWHPERSCSFRACLEAEGISCRVVKFSRFLEDNVEAIVKAVSADLPDVFVPNYCVPAYFAARFLREAGVATVGTLHSDDPYYHDIVDYFVSGPPQWRLSAVVGVSEFLRDLISSSGAESVPFLHAPYGAPVPPEAVHAPAQQFVMAYFGRIVERQKRITRVANAMIAAARSDSRISGIIWGEGPDAARVASLLAQSGGRVRLGGLVAPDAIQGKMGKAHAFVLLSDYEGLSIALMEAMACGLVPVVARMRSGIADLVVDGVNGLIVEPDDPAGFARAIQTLVDDAARWKRLSLAARQTILEREFTTAACAKKWARFLETLAPAPSRFGAVDLPPREDWALPKRSIRPDGIRSEDRRSVLHKALLAAAVRRPVFLWGASTAGESFLDSIGSAPLTVAGFIDSDLRKHGQTLRGISVFPPAQLTALRSSDVHPYVVVTSQYGAEIRAELVRLGLIEDDDFVCG